MLEDDVTGDVSSNEETESTETHKADEDKSESRKYAEKFDSVEDLEKAYGEAQGKMTQATQEAAEAKKTTAAAEQLNVQWQDWFAKQTDERGDPSQTAATNGEDEWTGDRKAVQQEAMTAAQQVMAVDRGANANIRAELGKRRKDKLFAEVADEYEAAMMRLNPHVMANPQQAVEAAEYLFNATVGKYARNMVAADSDPATRKAALEKLGFEPPARDETPPEDDRVQSDGRTMLADLGLSKEGQKRAIDRLENAEEGE